MMTLLLNCFLCSVALVMFIVVMAVILVIIQCTFEFFSKMMYNGNMIIEIIGMIGMIIFVIIFLTIAFYFCNIMT
jgi:hypothetical protein